MDGGPGRRRGSGAAASGQWGGGAVPVTVTGSLVRAVHPVGAVSHRYLLPPSGSARGPAARPWPVPGRRRPPSSSACSACPFRALVAKFSEARPSSDGQTRIVSWPPPATRPPIAGWLCSSRLPPHCPVGGVPRDTCSGDRAGRAPSPSGTCRSPAWAGAPGPQGPASVSGRERSWRWEDALCRSAGTGRLVLTFAPWLRAKLWAWG